MSQNQKIQRYIIQSTPFGELSDVLKDLDKISQIDPSSHSLNTTVAQYNQDHLALISHPQGQVVLMGHCRVADNRYVDQVRQKIYTVDHFKQEVLNVQDTEIQLVPEVKQLIKYLSQHVNAYVEKYFKVPHGSQVFAQISEEGLNVYVGFTSKNVSIGKFYTGEWISKWKINKDEVQGTVTIKAHYFEAGNVQFNQKRQSKQSFQFSPDMNESAKNITKIIQKFQSKLQESLNAVYDEMPQKFFKKLRRLAPYTKTKMSWNINTIKMTQNLIASNK